MKHQMYYLSYGGFLGTLAAIDNPMAIELASKLFLKGLQVGKNHQEGEDKDYK